MKSGEELYLRYIKGDDLAFAELVEQYFDSLMYFINRYIKDINEAESIASDAFFELMIGKRRFKAGNSVKTYLFTIGRNKAINFLKKHRRSVDISEAAELASVEITPEESVMRAERLKELDKALVKLPNDMQEAVRLIYFEELSYANAAKVMGVKTKKVDNLLSKAKKLLRNELEELK